MSLSGKKISRSEIVQKLASLTDKKQSETENTIKSLVELISNELSAGNDVEFWGFGLFSINKKQAGTGRNPKTGEKITYPERNVVKFYPGKTLQEKLNPPKK